MAGPGGHSGNIKPVYVARTVETSQYPFNAFLKTAALHLGKTGIIKKRSETHMTYLGAGGVRERMRAYGYGPAQVIAFSHGLQAFLDKRDHSNTNVRVEVDPQEPLVWMNKHCGRGQLAVKLLAAEGLLTSRESIEAYLLNQLGVMPKIRTFEPHITIGSLSLAELTKETRREPSALLSEYDLNMPHWIAMNGLMVYTGRIHSLSRRPEIVPSMAEEIQAWLDEMNEPVEPVELPLAASL